MLLHSGLVEEWSCSAILALLWDCSSAMKLQRFPVSGTTELLAAQFSICFVLLQSHAFVMDASCGLAFGFYVLAQAKQKNPTNTCPFIHKTGFLETGATLRHLCEMLSDTHCAPVDQNNNRGRKKKKVVQVAHYMCF